jgi:hypothetical protein
MRSAELSSPAPVRAAGLVLTLFATAAGAAGAATLSTAPSESQTIETRPVVSTAMVLDDIEEAKFLVRDHEHQREVEARAAAEAAEQQAKAVEAHARRVAMWDELADCETGGDWHNGGDYGGGLGIYVGTWRMYGGREFAARPQWASKEQQIEVAERIALDGYGGWGCAHRLGWVN